MSINCEVNNAQKSLSELSSGEADYWRQMTERERQTDRDQAIVATTLIRVYVSFVVKEVGRFALTLLVGVSFLRIESN